MRWGGAGPYERCQTDGVDTENGPAHAVRDEGLLGELVGAHGRAVES